FTALTIWLTLLTGIPDREDSADFYCLLLGATLGMLLMASANHLLMVFVAVEMASLPSYALAGFLKGRRQSSEAALKYVVQGGGPGPARPRRPGAGRLRPGGPQLRAGQPLLGRRRPLPPAGPGLLRRPDGDLRQPRRLRPDQPQAPARLLDHRPRRLHDDGP